MKLEDAIDSVISHNALIRIDVDDHNGFGHKVWSGMAWELPDLLKDKEFKPLCDYLGDSVECPLIIELKDDLKEEEIKVLQQMGPTKEPIYKDETNYYVLIRKVEGHTYYQTHTSGCGFEFISNVTDDIILWNTSQEANNELDRFRKEITGLKVAVFHKFIRIN